MFKKILYLFILFPTILAFSGQQRISNGAAIDSASVALDSAKAALDSSVVYRTLIDSLEQADTDSNTVYRSEIEAVKDTNDVQADTLQSHLSQLSDVRSNKVNVGDSTDHSANNYFSRSAGVDSLEYHWSHITAHLDSFSNHWSAIQDNSGGVSSAMVKMPSPTYRTDGVSEYASRADASKHDVGAGDFILSCKVRPETVSGTQTLINKEDGGIGYGLYMVGDDLYIRIDDGTNDSSGKIADDVFSVDSWTNISVVFDRSNNAIAYIDYEQAGTKDISLSSGNLDNNGELRWGSANGDSNYFNGLTNYIRGINTVLTEDQINSIDKSGIIPYEYLERNKVVDVETVGKVSDSQTNCPRSLSISGDYLYSANYGMSSIASIDVSDPTAPFVSDTLSKFSATNGCYDVIADGDYLYVWSSSADTIATVDISDPTNLSLLATFGDSDAGGNGRFDISGNYLYLASSHADGLLILDKTNPLSLSKVGSISNTTLDGAYNVRVVGDYAYVACSSDSLAVIDISTPSNPTMLSSIYAGENPVGIDVLGNYAYVGSSSSDSLFIVNVSNKSSLSIESTFTDPDIDGVEGIYTDGSYLYVAADNADNLTIIDVTTPSSPSKIDTIHSATHLESAADVVVSGNYAYVASYYWHGIVIASNDLEYGAMFDYNGTGIDSINSLWRDASANNLDMTLNNGTVLHPIEGFFAQISLEDTASAIRGDMLTSSALNDTASAIRSDMATTDDLNSYATQSALEDTAGAIRGDLSNVASSIYEIPESDGEWDGKADSLTVGETVNNGDLLYKKADGKYWKTDADTTISMIAEAIAVETISADDKGVCLREGYVREDNWNWTVGSGIDNVLFADDAIAGGLVQENNKPDQAGDIVQPVGHVYDANTIYFDPSKFWLKND